MELNELPQLRANRNGCNRPGSTLTSRNQQSYRNHNPGAWAFNADSDQAQFVSDFNLSRLTIVDSRPNVGYQEKPKRNTRSFTTWTVKLNNDNQLVVEGTLECGRRARTKPIAERHSASKVLSKFKHVYHLIGNIDDSENELPAFVRYRFQVGFPEDWETVLGIWRSFVNPGCNGAIKSSPMSEGLIVEKKLKLAMDDSEDSNRIVVLAQKVTRVDGEICRTGRNAATRNNNRYFGNSKDDRTFKNREIDYESEVDERSETMHDVKQLTAWTPFLVTNKAVNYCLAFKGTLLSSMGHAVSRNHVTEAVHRRLSARIIETVTREYYELIGDLNNTKRDVPKELVSWCRYGCPRHIYLFCEKLRTLKGNKMKFGESSPHSKGENTTDHDEVTSPKTWYKKAVNSTKNNRTNLSSMIQPVREKNKRKRLLMESNSYSSSSDSSIDNDTTFNEKPGATFITNPRSQLSCLKTILVRNSLETSREKHISEGKDCQIIQEVRSTAAMLEKKKKQPQQSSSLKPVPSLTYVYNRCTPLTENILSDGV